MHSIETINLTHKFSENETALKGVNLQVIEGTIYGFLGPNGAGKTTTLKLILGLLKKQHGEILVFGKPFEKHRVETLRNIGSMIESPSIYGHLTAVENLKVLQKVYQCPKRRIQEVLAVQLHLSIHPQHARFFNQFRPIRQPKNPALQHPTSCRYLFRLNYNRQLRSICCQKGKRVTAQ